MLAAARGDDGAGSNSADGVIVENDAHFGESGGQTYLTNEVGKEVNTFVSILHQPDFLCPATKLFFCTFVDMAIKDRRFLMTLRCTASLMRSLRLHVCGWPK